ncbi:hypothetical protein, partial [Bacillus cereus]|uniref:hypothetical protein n=1 Tax=Bacillus cereus TaxID=1396 RepID=UPI001A7E9823
RRQRQMCIRDRLSGSGSIPLVKPFINEYICKRIRLCVGFFYFAGNMKYRTLYAIFLILGVFAFISLMTMGVLPAKRERK